MASLKSLGISSNKELISVKVFEEDNSFSNIKVNDKEFEELLLSGEYQIPSFFYKKGKGYKFEEDTEFSELLGGFVTLIRRNQ